MTGRVHRAGFTLIELSIVLVIVGLIIGGVLAGQDLVRAAAERAQISQIEKYNTAANTFFEKYGFLPGDMPGPVATQFGFYVGANCTPSVYGSRNGDGFLMRATLPNSPPNDYEPGIFWEDLSSPKAGYLIEGEFGRPPYLVDCNGYTPISSVSTAHFNFPMAKIGTNNFIYAYTANGANWFGLTSLNSVSGSVATLPGLTVRQAYDIDSKTDDGLPTTGRTQAVYTTWGGTTGTTSTSNGAIDSSTTCYNNSTNTYSVQISGGSNVNCALSFKMQAGD